jgi:hypothetical protein
MILLFFFGHLDQWCGFALFWSSWFEKFPDFNEIDYALGQGYCKLKQ